MTVEVPGSSRLSRFIFSKSHFARESRRVKHGAFVPTYSAKIQKLAASVLDGNELSEADIWSAGVTFAEAERTDGRKLKARADIKCEVVLNCKDCNLAVIRETSLHELHANIENWPEVESAQLLAATELSQKSKLELPSETELEVLRSKH